MFSLCLDIKNFISIQGPMPPWEQRESEEDSYAERLARFEAEQAQKVCCWMKQKNFF